LKFSPQLPCAAQHNEVKTSAEAAPAADYGWGITPGGAGSLVGQLIAAIIEENYFVVLFTWDETAQSYPRELEGNDGVPDGSLATTLQVSMLTLLGRGSQHYLNPSFSLEDTLWLFPRLPSDVV